MTNKALVELTYNENILIDAADLPKLMSILDGATVVDYGYLDVGRVDFERKDPYALKFTQAPVKIFTINEFKAMEETQEALKAAQEAPEILTELGNAGEA